VTVVPTINPDSVPLTLWGANLIGRPLQDRLAAAIAGGFAATTLFPIEIRRGVQDGTPPSAMRGMFAEHGIAVTVVDPLAHWLPGGAPPPPLPGDDPAAGAFHAAELFALAEAVGAERVTVIAVYEPHVDSAAGAEAFAALCDRAADHGLRLQLEFIPGSGIADLAHAWEIVRLADRRNGGLILDSWHFFRSGSDPALLDQIPAERVFSVQIEDAPARPADDLATESLHGRFVPGEGELDLSAFLAPILRRGVPACIGPEVFSDALRSVEAADLGRRLATSTRVALAAAWPAAAESMAE
jgi:sugar phosphate isomerase/epimerase